MAAAYLVGAFIHPLSLIASAFLLAPLHEHFLRFGITGEHIQGLNGLAVLPQLGEENKVVAGTCG